MDGVIEINQACATQTGCVPSDAPGFPVVTEPLEGTSYRLTSNLLVDSPTQTAIVINGWANLDLNGFTISCALPPDFDPCVPAPNSGDFQGGDGVRVVSQLNRAVEIRNGTIAGMGDEGIELGEDATVKNVRVLENGDVGLKLGSNCVVEQVQAFRNDGHGIQTGLSCSVSNSTASENGANGMKIEGKSTISESTASSNQQDGIDGGVGSVISHSTAVANQSSGLVVSGGTVVGCNAQDNDGTGIVASGGVVNDNTVVGGTGFLAVGVSCSSSGCTVVGNRISGQVGIRAPGAFLGSPCSSVVAYGENLIAASPAVAAFNPSQIPVVTCAVQIGANVCGTDTTCP